MVRMILQRRKWQPLQYSCLENAKDGGAWQATVHWVAESDMTEHTHTHTTTTLYGLSFCVNCLEHLPFPALSPRHRTGTSQVRTRGAASPHQSNGRTAGLVKSAPV